LANPHPNTDGLKATQWKPGQSGNPGGRPRRILTDRYVQLMESLLPREIALKLQLPLNSTWGDAVALVSARTALKSTEVGVSQRRELADRCEGKAPVRVQFESSEEIDINVTFEASPFSNKNDTPIDIEVTESADLPGDAGDGELEKE
jgi:hypothetical protein